MKQILSFEEVVLLAKGDSEWAEIEDVAKVAKELLALRSKVETQTKIIAAYNAGGFADADAVVLKYLEFLQAIQTIQRVASGAQQVAMGDLEGMIWIDKYAQNVIATGQADHLTAALAKTAPREDVGK